ncbi:MAG: hypothetical protein NXY57DRAFT_1002410 [Lentinula lateritia]|nr:MAG: hypothetical protein NXY57DRAFT_1002410 [Lentinula lateritia]
MHTFAWICCLIIIITVVFSPNINRQSTWINLNISWIIACFVFAFLLTTGQLYKTSPHPSVCLFQAAAVNAVSSLVAGTMLALSLQLWLNFRFNSGNLTVPLIQFLASLGYAGQHPQQVALTDSGMFCGFTDPIPGRIASIYSAVLMIPTASAQVLLWRYTYRNWYKISKNSRNDLITMIRLGLFTVFGIVGVIVSILNLTMQVNSSVVNILESLPPVCFVFIFGLQEDLFRAWMFWRTYPSVLKSTSTVWSGIRLIKMPTENEQSQTKTTWTDA